MRWIYISPHFDDAVLSCGGLIYEQTRQGIPVEIWTTCAGFPPKDRPLSELAVRCHKSWNTKTGRGTIILRRREDKAAAAMVGAIVRHFPHADCIYRWTKDGSPMYVGDVFAGAHPEDVGDPDLIASLLKRGLHKDDVVVSPLSVGHHIDHVLTRQGVERLGRALVYYTDVPYVLNHPEELESCTIGLSSTLSPVAENSLQAWVAGIEAYNSQIKMLFNTQDNIQPVIRNYWAQENGIRLWRPQ
jgi:LmbE family N-acetylglucosaminyl deacetylase